MKATPKISKLLIDWYRDHKRALPWRGIKEPYKIWISEIMLQQTQVDQVIPYYKKFIRRFPTLKKLAKSELDEVYKIWQGLGYYRRASLAHAASKLILSKWKGKIPSNYDLIRQLPGFGEYTAGAVLSLAYGKPYPAIDGNVNRVISRIYNITDEASTSAFKQKVKDYTLKMLVPDFISDFNQSLMELGSLICRPKKPLCSECPVQKFCASRGNADHLPRKKQKPKNPHYHVVIGIICKRDKILIVKRPHTGLLANLWEFPGGKKEKKESLEDACKRELLNKVNLHVSNLRKLIFYKHMYSHLHTTLHFYLTEFKKGDIRLKKNTAFKWVSIDNLKDYPFPTGHLRAIELLCQ